MAALDNSQISRRPHVPDWLRQGESRLRLQTIVRLRWLAVLGQTITVVGAYWVLGIDLPIGGCLAVIALSAWINVALRIRYPASQRRRTMVWRRKRLSPCRSQSGTWARRLI